MKIIENEEFTGQVVLLDGQEYRHCAFVRCTLVYRALQPTKLTECAIQESEWRLEGAASLTMDFLQQLYQGGGRGVVEAAIASIRGLPVRRSARPSELTLEQLRGRLMELKGDGTWVTRPGTRLELLSPRRDIGDGRQVTEVLITNGADEIAGLWFSGPDARFHPEVPDGWQWWSEQWLNLRRDRQDNWHVG